MVAGKTRVVCRGGRVRVATVAPPAVEVNTVDSGGGAALAAAIATLFEVALGRERYRVRLVPWLGGLELLVLVLMLLLSDCLGCLTVKT